MAEELDITRRRGDTYANEIQVVSNVDGVTPIDITGYSFLQTVDPERKPADDTNNLFQIIGVILNASSGIVGFSPSDVQADNLGKYFHDIQMTDDSGKIRTVAAGRYTLVQDVTK